MKNKIVLKFEERKKLECYIKKGNRNVRLVNRAKIILAVDTSEGRNPKSKTKISDELDISRQTVYDVIKYFEETQNVDIFLKRKKRKKPPIEPKLTGDIEARVIALACGEVPEGRARWTLRLLAEKAVELEIIDSISFKSVQRILKKTNLSLT